MKLEPLGTLRGRILDDDGQPIAGVQVRLAYAHKFIYHPVDSWGARSEQITTDNNGHFRIERIIPGLELSLSAKEKAKFLSLGDEQKRRLSLQPGEDKDLGDMKAKAAE